MDTETKHLPQDLITAILLRLPVKSLLRFKAVCKFWRSLISNPNFAQSHCELATPRLVFNAKLGIQTMDLDGWLHSNPISEPIYVDFLPTGSSIRIVGSCRGFLLLESVANLINHNQYSIWLWNPSTHVHKPIPTSPFDSNLHRYIYGFGYDSSKDDYLVVQVPLLLRPTSSPICSAPVQFFSTRANMWKCIEGINSRSLNISSGDRRPGLLFNEAIHWVAYDHDKSMDVIIVFDLMEKRILELPHPDPVDLACRLSSCNLWVYGRFLSLSVKRSDTVEIFVMENYKVQSSWTKTIVLSLSGIFPVCSTKGGDIVMDGFTKLVKFSDKGEQLEHREYRGYLEPRVPMYTESMLSLPGDNEQS